MPLLKAQPQQCVLSRGHQRKHEAMPFHRNRQVHHEAEVCAGVRGVREISRLRYSGFALARGRVHARQGWWHIIFRIADRALRGGTGRQYKRGQHTKKYPTETDLAIPTCATRALLLAAHTKHRRLMKPRRPFRVAPYWHPCRLSARSAGIPWFERATYGIFLPCLENFQAALAPASTVHLRFF